MSQCLGQYGDQDRQSVVSVVFWGCIAYKGVGKLVPVEGNMNSEKNINVLDECLWPVVTKHFPTDRWTLQDNAPCQFSVRTTQWKRDNHIPTLSWPPQSPDLNIIENAWQTLKIQLKRSVNDIKSKLPLHYIHSLFQSIPTRLRAVMRGK